MTQTFIVTIDAEDNIKSKEISEALNLGTGPFSLEFNHDEIIVVKARKINKKKEGKK